MNLVVKVDEAFSPHGVLSRTLDDFVPRSGQKEMACAVTHAIENGRRLVVEASTGVGKTFSYLVPSLLSGERILLSTATKVLQDQLFVRDLPRLIEALKLPVQTALLKGRSSYLCLHRLDVARQNSLLFESVFFRALATVEQWSHVTQTGDLAELPGLDERSPIIPLVTSTRDNCLGSLCPKFRQCHVNLARREAMAADVVVINHHLFFADLAVRESGMAELLPSMRIVIFDEAHQLNETGVQFLGNNLTSGQLLDFSKDMLVAGLQLARGLVNWQEVVGSVERAARELRLCVGKQFIGKKLRWTEGAPEGLNVYDWQKSLEAVLVTCQQACVELDTVSEIAPDFLRLQERGAKLVELVNSFSGDCQPGHVRWAEVGMNLRLIESPLDISRGVEAKIFGKSIESMKTWIFTSATLGDDAKLSWFTQPCGLKEADVLRIGSPFDYKRQAAIYVPSIFPKSSDASHPAKVAECAAIWARQLGGRTMVLTTTLHALRLIGQSLRSDFGQSDDLEVLVQGEMPKRALIDRFREGGSRNSKGCVLVAAGSFWEGIDIPGNALQLVIIDKLPFPPPNDPVVEAKSKSLKLQGLSPFNHYFLPEAAIALRQGAGRLIRRESDQGVLVVCDTRMISMGYGKRLMEALPPMEKLLSEQELMDRLSSLTKICTKDFQRAGSHCL